MDYHKPKSFCKYSKLSLFGNNNKGDRKVPNHIIFDADQIAKDVNNPKGTNMVVLGAASKYLKIDLAKLEDAVRQNFARKGEAVVEANIQALRAGREVADKKL